MLATIGHHRARIARFVLIVWVFVTLFAVVGNVRAWAQDGPKPDPSGSITGAAADIRDAGGNAFVPPAPADTDDAKSKAEKAKAVADFKDASSKEPLAAKLADSLGQTQVALNVVWTLLTGFLVMFMQAGFAMVEAGFCRAKNATHVIMTNFMIYPIGMLGFWLVGFSLMFGSLAASKIGGPVSLGGLPTLNGSEFSIGGFGIAGWNTPLLGGNLYDVGVYTMFLFQMVFMDTTATIPTGAMAERWKFGAFMVYGFFVSMIAYPIYGHMVWGGGGLAMLGLNNGLGHGVVDFAGSSVVHAVGGGISLAGAMVIGPRIGKYDSNGKPKTIPAHHIPMAIIGTFILAFGWFGFNPGSTLGATGSGNLRIGIVAVNTMLASAGGALSAILYMKAKTDKFDAGMSVNGFLGGLVAITAPCAFVSAWAAVVIGLIAGVLVVASCFFWERVGIDDPVGAISVHGVGGIFGLLCVGIFADGKYGGGWNGVGAAEYLGKAGQGVTGVLYGDSKQLVAQIIGSIVCIAWSFGSALVFFKIQNAIKPIRPSREDELAGLDIPEMGALAYPYFSNNESDIDLAAASEPTPIGA